MTTVVKLPQAFRVGAIDRFTRDIVDVNGNPKDNDFIFDFSNIGFIDGSGYTVFRNALGWLLSRGVSCSFKDFNLNRSNAICYLDDCGFFNDYLGHPLSRSAQVRASTLPCTSIESAMAFSWIENRLSPWIGRVFDKPYEALSSLRTCVKELFNNISDHSTKSTGFVHTQHYPNIRTVNITVSDFGIGIPTTIRGRFGDMSDAAAIYMAAQEGVTAKSKPNNMGAGLNYLIDTVTNNNGSVLIHSLSGSLFCIAERNRQQRKMSVSRGSYPGTLVDISFDTRLFTGDDYSERGDVEW